MMLHLLHINLGIEVFVSTVCIAKKYVTCNNSIFCKSKYVCVLKKPISLLFCIQLAHADILELALNYLMAATNILRNIIYGKFVHRFLTCTSEYTSIANNPWVRYNYTYLNPHVGARSVISDMKRAVNSWVPIVFT